MFIETVNIYVDIDIQMDIPNIIAVLYFPIVLFHRASKVAATRGARMDGEDRRHVLESRLKVQGGPGPGHHQSFPSGAGSCFVEGEGLLAF